MGIGTNPGAAQTADPAWVTLSGLLERVTFHNADNGFCVLRVKARGQRELVTVVGHAPMVSAGEWVTATGEWANDLQHGLQFKARFLRTSTPTSLVGIEKYLASGMIRGVGPVYARKLVRAFGEQVFDIIEREPARLREVEGVGPVRAARITDAWTEQRAVRDIMVFLHGHGVGTARAVRIFKTYGTAAVTIMTENPYRLAWDIRGIGFKTADAIAMRLGIEPTAAIRIRAGLAHALTTAMDEGHCGLPLTELLPLTMQLLEVPESLVQEAITHEQGAGSIAAADIGTVPCLFLTPLLRAEEGIAEQLRRLAHGIPPWPPIAADKALAWVNARNGLALAPSQEQAVRAALAARVFVITGGPGVGKTTLVHSILQILAAKGVEILLAAPTGRAAKRLAESTGRDARTLHRLLEVDARHGGFKRNAQDPLRCDLLVIDEVSMVDVWLLRAVLLALPAHAGIWFVGDIDQLPSVGPGQVLKDIIDSGLLPVARLTEVFRQAARSQIVASAHRVNQGWLPDLERPNGPSDFYFVPAEDPEQAVARIVDLVKVRIPKRFHLHPLRDIQVLCPMNRGGVGAVSLNIALQAALNPEPHTRIERFGWTFAPGDRIMQIENDYDKEVYNGDMGTIEALDLEQGTLQARFDERVVTYDFSELDTIVPGYAATIHKSQGSEYPAVVIPILTQHYPMLQRNLLYTGITRGRRLVVLVGQRKALAMAVRNATQRRRWTRLQDLLQQPLPVFEE